MNEPECFVSLGMECGFHAPGDNLGVKEILLASHHLLLSHGRAVEVIRSRAKTPPIIGWACIAAGAYPETNSELDIQAARDTMFDYKYNTFLNCGRNVSIWNNAWWGDPIVFGTYPEDAWKAFGKTVPKISDGDMKLISQLIDFYGANIYSALKIRYDATGKPVVIPLPEGAPLTALRWAVIPEALGWSTKLLYDRYKLPMVIAENGLSCHDWISLDGEVHDPQRIDFLHRYLLSLAESIKDGVDVFAYFQWSIMDNFEWTDGYKDRFGLIYIDYPTQKRILKDSAKWYKTVIKSNGESLTI